MLVYALSGSHKAGLAAVGAVFILFALASAFLAPRYRPDFPGRFLRGFIALSVVVFLGMLAAVETFGRESEKKEPASEAKPAATTPTKGPHVVKVTEVDFKIKMPTNLSEGSYEFDVKNDGPSPHNLTVKGPTSGATSTFNAGKSETLKLDLKKGSYTFYCSVPGHEQLGMKVSVTVP